jgi:pimeloyl-ACP methyl ester carboxylesterase
VSRPRGLLGSLGLAALGEAALRRVGPAIGAGVDELGARALWYRSPAARRRSAAESLGPEERMRALDAIARLYGDAALIEEPDRFFGTPRLVEPDVRRVAPFARDGARASVEELAWPSRVEPYVAELAERCGGVVENRTARARVYRGEGARRPVAILVHGYRGGGYAFEERAWPVAALLRRGLDVALIQLPHHAQRARPGSGPRFPGSDPRLANEGFGQAIRDLRDLVHLARRGWGASAVVAMGMSLGGYTVSLLGTVEPELDFVAPIIPLASLADAARDNDRLVGTPAEREAQHRALEAAYRVTSPLARAPRLDPARAIVVAAEGDRITPITHARRIAAHYGCELVTFPGGHLLQLGRADGFRAILRRLEAAGITSCRTGAP